MLTCWPQVSSSRSDSSPSSRRAETMLSSSAAGSASSRPTAVAGCRTSTPGLRPGSGLIPMTGCPSRYLATLATSPSWPTATTMSSGAKRNRGRSARSTEPRRQSAGMAAPTSRSAARTASCRAWTVSRSRPRWRRKYAAAARVPCRPSSSSSSLRRDTTTTRGARVFMAPHRQSSAESRHEVGDHVRGDRELADLGQLAGQLAEHEGLEDAGGEVAVCGDPGRFGLALGQPDRAYPGRPRLVPYLRGICLGRGGDLRALGLQLGHPAGVRAVLLDQLLLAPG